MKINNATPNVKYLSNNKKNNVAFSGNPAGNTGNKFFKDLFKLGRNGAMTRELFTLNAFVFLLGSRLFTSRDKNEVRETATRDIPTIVVAVFGVPFFEKFIAHQFQKRSGFALGSPTENNKGVQSKCRLDVASSSQIEDWYKYDDKLAKGFDGFTDRLDKLGGNLKAIYSKLGKDTKEKLSSFSENNQEFKKQLSENKELKQTIADMFKSKGNKAFEQARFLSNVPKILGLAITLSLLGICIPKLNIHLTEKINKNKTQNETECKKDDVAKENVKVEA